MLSVFLVVVISIVAFVHREHSTQLLGRYADYNYWEEALPRSGTQQADKKKLRGVPK